MIKVGLTGTMGSGKSVVASIFARLGVPVYAADHHAREILTQEAVKLKLYELFGPAIFDASGQVLRAKLADQAFNNPDYLESLNNLIHPLVKENFDAWLEVYKESAYIIHEAAILFESGFASYFDKIIVVDAPIEVCISRVMQRDGITLEKVKDRMQHQWAREEKVSRADYIIVNDGTNLVLPQILELHATLKKLASIT